MCCLLDKFCDIINLGSTIDFLTWKCGWQSVCFCWLFNAMQWFLLDSQSKKQTISLLSMWDYRKPRKRDGLLRVLSVHRTWAMFRKRHCCWRLICVWRKWREHEGRNHPTGRKRPVEVMAGLEGLGSCVMAVCSTHNTTHRDIVTQSYRLVPIGR